ncbi:MAG TPA: type VI secretion system protein TssA [Polyangiaceae bacterium]|nr:type VI secretion system protein TssA [Polyangiaceae bacterium]
MASIDLEKLLEPVSDGAPSGVNLEYDKDFLTLERLALGRPEQQMGGSIRPAEPPDYEAVVREASSLLARSKDLRIAVLLARALAHLRGFQGLSDGLALVQGLLDRYFATVFPELDPSDGNDPTMRITAVAGLCASDVLAALRSRPLLVSRTFGPITLRDLAAAAGSAASEGAKPDQANIEAAFQDTDLDEHQRAANLVQAAVAHLAAIEAVFQREHAGHGPELAALADLLRQAQYALVSRLDRRIAAAQPAPTASAPGSAAPGAAGPPVGGFNGDIRSRADVLRALDKICEYYAEFEPSSPIPLLLHRGRRLVSKSFLDIIRDMAPDGVSQVESIAGKADA